MMYKLPVLTCNWWTCCHRNSHQAQQVTNGLRGPHGPYQLKGNRSHYGDEAAITQSHEQTHRYQTFKHTALRDHHRHQAQSHERGHLHRKRNIKAVNSCRLKLLPSPGNKVQLSNSNSTEIKNVKKNRQTYRLQPFHNTCKYIFLTPVIRSPTLPKSRRPAPEDAPIHTNRTHSFCVSPNSSFTKFICLKQILVLICSPIHIFFPGRNALTGSWRMLQVCVCPCTYQKGFIQRHFHSL